MRTLQRSEINERSAEEGRFALLKLVAKTLALRKTGGPYAGSQRQRF